MFHYKPSRNWGTPILGNLHMINYWLHNRHSMFPTSPTSSGVVQAVSRLVNVVWNFQIAFGVLQKNANPFKKNQKHVFLQPWDDRICPTALGQAKNQKSRRSRCRDRPWTNQCSLYPMTDPWCCYIWCAMDPIKKNTLYVSIFLPAPWIRHGYEMMLFIVFQILELL